MEYIILEGYQINELQAIVRDHIAVGWKPIGGVSISLSESTEYQYFCVAQAMIRGE